MGCEIGNGLGTEASGGSKRSTGLFLFFSLLDAGSITGHVFGMPQDYTSSNYLLPFPWNHTRSSEKKCFVIRVLLMALSKRATGNIST